jgi:predicted CopG family antitoxin
MCLRLKNKESETSLKSELDTNSISELLSQKSDDLDIASSDLGNLSTNDVAEVTRKIVDSKFH